MLTNADRYVAFISYRRESGAAEARLIRAELRARNVRAFLDVDDLKAGHFDEALLKRIAEVPNFIVILSTNCLDRCADRRDWFRREIAEAIKTERNIIPVLMPGFIFPDRAGLPDELRELVTHQGLEYSHKYCPAMIAELISFLRSETERNREIVDKECTSASLYARKSGDFHRKRHIEVAKNRERMLIWISGITLVGTGLALLTTYLTLGKPWWEITYAVFVFLAVCWLWAPRFYRTWTLDWNDHEIVVINWWSLLGRSGEELWIDGRLNDKRLGRIKFSSDLCATIITPEREHAVDAHLGSILGGLRVGCQVVIDNELVGGDTKESFYS